MDLSYLNKANGCLKLEYSLDESQNQIYNYRQQEPLRFLFPPMPELTVPCGVLINIAGGIVGGDNYKTDIQVGNGCKALITSQAAEKIYSSSFANAHINTVINTQENSWFEWLPQETILFNQSRLKRNLIFRVTPTSAVMGGEILIFGRGKRGETFQNGFLQDHWSIYWDNNLIWKDVLFLEEDSTLKALQHPAGFKNATAYATFVYITDKAENNLTLARRFLKHCKVQNSATAFNNLLLIRWLSEDPFQLRREYGYFWCFWRKRVASLPRQLPRIWHF